MLMNGKRETEKKATPRLAVDFFSGSGSVTEALKNAGYDVVAGLDIDPGAAKTYKLNHPEVDFFETDIRGFGTEELVKLLNGRALDILAICAPCQPFSSQNRKRTEDDLRRSLVLESLRFVRDIRPKNIWVENVPGLGNSRVIDELQKQLKALGYFFEEPIRVDAANLGVPQRRIRFVFFASLHEKSCTSFSSLASLKLQGSNVRSAFEGLKQLAVGESDLSDPLHWARKHSELTLKRLRCVPSDGGSRSSFPVELQLECHKKLSVNSFPDVYGRMSWSIPAPTLTTGCTDVTRGRFAHPEEDRAITLREAARLQTFPDSYKFFGNKSQVAVQIGNAVPMQMAYEMFCRISSCDEGLSFRPD
jgi:DNA (cytosine-5)-methyltransferase 1